MDIKGRTPISEKDFKEHFSLAEGFGDSEEIIEEDKIFDFDVVIEPTHRDVNFKNCHFKKNVCFEKGVKIVKVSNKDSETDLFEETNQITNIFDVNVTFENNCEFDSELNLENINFRGKFRIHDCFLNELNFKNTTFDNLADFWKTKFKKPVIFYKTDFNSTVVFSMAKFSKNVLFTYSLLGGKAIFARTKFKKGFDVSQAVISGDLQLFNLKFVLHKYKNIYKGDDDEIFQNCIDTDAVIPLVNKVHTFQILKKAFIDNGNYSDSILMQREEKKALRELTKERIKDRNTKDVNLGDKYILWLNRWSNNYQSDFRNGILFTIIVTLLFGSATLIFTESFHNNFHFCSCEFNEQVFIKGIKFFVNFFNPTRSLDYLNSLNPIYFGIAYLFDFLGRIAVSYGIYQTVQAFRKFK